MLNPADIRHVTPPVAHLRVSRPYIIDRAPTASLPWAITVRYYNAAGQLERVHVHRFPDIAAAEGFRP
jgi:hypothetical protein